MAEEFAGTLTERVAIETWVAGRDSYGADAGHWRADGVVAAALVPDAGSRGVAGEARRSGRRWQVKLRTPPALGLLSRLVWRGRVLNVLASTADLRRPGQQTLVCEEQAA